MAFALRFGNCGGGPAGVWRADPACRGLSQFFCVGLMRNIQRTIFNKK